MSYRPGDVMTELGLLRLTVGGLAELAERFEADTPSELSDQIRGLSPDGARHLLSVLLRPSGSEAQVARLSDSDIAKLMPAAARTIAQALS